MKNNKIRLLYDAKILSYGAQKDSNRTGVYFTALNILKCLVKYKNIEITLFNVPNIEKYKNVKSVIKKEFPNNNFDIINLKSLPDKELVETLCYVQSVDSLFFKKFFIYLLIYSHYYSNVLILKIYSFILNLFKPFDAFFSPYLGIYDEIKYLHIKKKYIFMHDIIPKLFPQYFPLRGKKWFDKLYSTVNDNDHYLTNSENTKIDCLKYLPEINPDKIYTVYVGCNIEPPNDLKNIEKIKKKYGIPLDKKYIFSLCSIEPRKNLIRIVKTFTDFINKNNINDLIFVMGGSTWKAFEKQFKDETSQLLDDKIIQLGYVDDEDVPLLYAGALWFTYTSEYEGFGSPILEAMKCGCPVITSNHSSMPEVIGDAGIKIKWNSDGEHIKAYEDYYFNENLRKENIKKGLERAKMFSWDKTTNKIIDIMLNK